jgi:toxin ParE1/3/4
MSYKYFINDKAFQELTKAKQWYDEHSIEAGNHLLDEVVLSVAKISRSPNRYRLVTKIVRRYNLKTFPYSIYYRIKDDSIIILRIRHHKQKMLKRYR